MATSHRTGWIVLVAALVAAACDSSSDDPGEASVPAPATDAPDPTVTGQPNAEAVILESPDGVVQLEVPAGAVLEGTPLAIELVDPADVPGLDGATVIGSAYRLVPTELTFPEPLQILYQLPLADTGRTGAVPLVYTVIERDGTALRTVRQRTEVVADDLRHVSQTDRFGTFALLDGAVDLTLDPTRIDDLAGEATFEATLTLALPAGPVEPGYDVEVLWEVSGAITIPPGVGGESVQGFGTEVTDPVTFARMMTCTVTGGGAFTATLSIVLSSQADDPAPNRQLVRLGGEATCGDVGR